MGLAHRIEEDMEFAEYLLPKKSILLVGAWWFCHDPETYADPDAFEPQRYLAPRNEPDPRAVVFGYGRRRCPGRLIADGLLFLNIARTLAVFSISGAPDTKLVQLSGALMHPKPFKHSIIPRSKEHAELLQSAAGARAPEKSDAEFLNMPVNEL
jgi:cytochrome P450